MSNDNADHPEGQRRVEEGGALHHRHRLLAGVDEIRILLAERRAEVEALRKNPADAQKDAHENAEAVSSARDAALEEAATEATRRAGLARRVYVGTEKAPMGDGAGAALETLAADLRALKSSPVSVLPVDKVREEARKAIAQDMPGLWKLGVAALADALGGNVDDILPDPSKARRLGVDLDAKTWECAMGLEGCTADSPCRSCESVPTEPECGCGHTSIGSNSLCAKTIRTASGAVASCGCSHPSHAMPDRR
jgi:hypothetical protein